MMNIFAVKFATVLALATLTALPAAAQSGDASSLSAAEIEQLFQTQKTRGLVLAPSGVEPATPEAGDILTTPATYVELDREEQINIRVSFDFDSAALRNDQKPKLATLCEVMKTIDVQQFRIVGHTDASGSASYNQRLSQLRADEVKRHMVSDCGISAERLEAVGVGKDFLFDKDDPRSDENRRVEFQALS